MNKNNNGAKICPRCNTTHNKPGTYCCRSCANVRTYTPEYRKKISNGIKHSDKYKKGMELKNRRFEEDSGKKSISRPTVKCYMSKEEISKSLKNAWKIKRKNYIKNTKFENLSWYMIKKIVLQEKNNTCELCGYNKTRENGIGPIQIHHIDGNHDNNKRNNLQVLCLNCHFLTNNYCMQGKKMSKKSIQKGINTKKENGYKYNCWFKK